MFSFTIFGFRVHVQWWFWVLTLVLGSGFLSVPGRMGFFLLVSWLLVFFVSVLWHELGHAFAFQTYGAANPEIVLHGIGGHCTAHGRYSQQESIIISFAGPMYNFVLGFILIAIYKFILGGNISVSGLSIFAYGVNTHYVDPIFTAALYANIILGLLNLLPIYPLDGGRIFEAIMANRNPSIAPMVGTVVAGGLVILGALRGELFMIIVCGMLTYQNWLRWQGKGHRRIF